MYQETADNSVGSTDTWHDSAFGNNVDKGRWLAQEEKNTQRALSVITRLRGGRGHTDKEHNHASISLIEPLGGGG